MFKNHITNICHKKLHLLCVNLLRFTREVLLIFNKHAMNKFIKIPKTKIFERLIIIILLISLGFLLIRENYASRIINRFEGGEFVYTYDKNPNFFKETELYDYYKEKGNVVMLGNSITYQCRWDELLQRHDIINKVLARI